MIRLMLADDEQDERDYIEKVIQDSYPTVMDVVYKAVDGQDLWDNINEYKPHIVLLDIKMPRMDGLETATKIRKKFPEIQLVIISAYNDFNYAKTAMKAGINEYLLKPYTNLELTNIIDKILARYREKEDMLSMLSNTSWQDREFDFFKEIGKNYLWNLFYDKVEALQVKEMVKLLGADKCWLKVVIISSEALSIMGDFSQEVLKNYFQMNNVTVINSIWINQMAICMFAEDKEDFSDLNGCIKRARDYLEEEHQITVSCGVSGLYDGIACLKQAYEEAVSFILLYAEEDEKQLFQYTTDCMQELCDLEESIAEELIASNKEFCIAQFERLIQLLEVSLGYQDKAVKLNFTRSLMTIMHTINKSKNIRIKTTEVLRMYKKIEQLNFNGESLKDYLDFFVDIEIVKV